MHGQSRRTAGAEDRRRDEAGFTLVEVTLAMVLALVIILGAVVVITRGLSNSAALQQQQTATTVASQAVELARAVDPRATDQLPTGLVGGRAASSVTSQWRGATAPGLSDSWPVSDPRARAGRTVPTLPLTATTTVGSTAYSVTTWVGVCNRVRTSASDACTKQGGVPPAAPGADYVRMVRLVVQVTWRPTGTTSCPGGRCSVTTAALVDPSNDLTWNSTTSGAGS